MRNNVVDPQIAHLNYSLALLAETVTNDIIKELNGKVSITTKESLRFHIEKALQSAAVLATVGSGTANPLLTHPYWLNSPC